MTGSVADIRAPNIRHSTSGSLYMRNVNPPRYLQRNNRINKQWQEISKEVHICTINRNQDLKNAYTKIPVTIDAINVPRIANVAMAPKFEKNGFCKGQFAGCIRYTTSMQEQHVEDDTTLKHLPVLSWTLIEYVEVKKNIIQLRGSYSFIWWS